MNQISDRQRMLLSLQTQSINAHLGLGFGAMEQLNFRDSTSPKFRSAILNLNHGFGLLLKLNLMSRIKNSENYGVCRSYHGASLNELLNADFNTQLLSIFPNLFDSPDYQIYKGLMNFLWSYSDSNNLFSVYDGPGVNPNQTFNLDSGFSQWYDLCMDSLMHADTCKFMHDMKERELIASFSEIYKDLNAILKKDSTELKPEKIKENIDWVLQNSGPYILAHLYKLAYSILMDIIEDDALFDLIPVHFKIKDNLKQFISLYQPLYAHNKAIQPLDSLKQYLPMSAHRLAIEDVIRILNNVPELTFESVKPEDIFYNPRTNEYIERKTLIAHPLNLLNNGLEPYKTTIPDDSKLFAEHFSLKVLREIFLNHKVLEKTSISEWALN